MLGDGADFVIGQTPDGAPIHHAGYVAARSAMQSLFDTSTQLARTEREAKATDDDRVVRRLRDAATKTVERLGKSADDALNLIHQHHAQAVAQVDDALGIPAARTQVADSLRASDIRSGLRALAPKDRAAAIRQALTDGDREVASAILSAPPVASGINRNEWAGIRMEAERLYADPQVRIRDGLASLREKVDRAGALVFKRFAPLTATGDDAHSRAERSLSALEQQIGGAQ
jgi:hypothetical protein